MAECPQQGGPCAAAGAVGQRELRHQEPEQLRVRALQGVGRQECQRLEEAESKHGQRCLQFCLVPLQDAFRVAEKRQSTFNRTTQTADDVFRHQFRAVLKNRFQAFEGTSILPNKISNLDFRQVYWTLLSHLVEGFLAY